MNEPRAAAAPALRRLWQSAWPGDRRRPGPLVFAPSGTRVALGSDFELNIDGDSIGMLTVYDAADGRVVRQTADNWVVGPIAFSPDGLRLMTAEIRFQESGQREFERVRVLDADTFDVRADHSVDFQNQTPLFSPDGRLLVINGFPIAVLDVMSGAELWRADQDVGVLGWSPGGTSLAAGWRTPDLSPALAVLDPGNGVPRLVMPTPGVVDALAYSPDGQLIVIGTEVGAGCVISVFDADTGKSLGEFPEGGLGQVLSIAIAADGRSAAVRGRSQDGGDMLGGYDLVTGGPRFPLRRIDGATDFGFGPMRYSATLRHIIVQGGGGQGVVVFDARTGREYARTGPNDACCDVAPDGGSIVAGIRTNPFQFAGAVERYDLGIEVSRRTAGAVVTALTMAPGGTPLVAVADLGSAVTVMDAASGVALANRPIPGTITSLVFAGQGQAIAVGGSDGVRVFPTVGADTPGAPHVWRADTIGVVNALAVGGSGGEWIAVAAGKTVRLSHSLDGHARWPNLVTHPQTVTRVAAAPDGGWVATGCVDRRARLLDGETGAEAFSVEGDGRVRALAFTADGALLAAANEDGAIVLVDPAAASERGRVTRPFGCARIAFAFDGTLLAAAWDDNTVTVHDLTTGESVPPKLRELRLAAPVSGLAFSPVEHTLAIAAEGASVVVHDARDGAELVRILQPAPVSHFAFSADGALIATAGDDKVVRVWTSGSAPREQEIRP